MKDELESEATPPPLLKERVMRSLRAQGVLRPRGSRWGARAQIAAGIVLLMAGVAAGRFAWPSPALSTSDEPQYLLVLHEDAAFDPGRATADLVREYGAWAAGLREQRRLVVAEKLDDWSYVLPAPPAGDPTQRGGVLGAMTGFFLIRAASPERALEVARTHPHLAYGGRIVVRGVDGR